MEKKIICLITPGHVCSCPRLIKEAKSLSNQGHIVHIIASAYMPYLLEHDALIKGANPSWKIHKIDWPKGSWRDWKSKIKHHVLKKIAGLFHLKSLYPYLLNRNFAWQLAKAKSIKADLYIAHNAGSIAVAALAAKYHQTQYGFDAEDFHTGEGLSSELTLWVSYVQDIFLSTATYITAGSPLIAAAYQKLLDQDVFPILNVFPQNNLSFENRKDNKPLRLFWFSQTIGKGRGLEEIFKALTAFKTPEIELHLLGNLIREDALFFESLATTYRIPKEMLYYHTSVAESELLFYARKFDVGLSLERDIPLNRDLCLSNKLFVYMQAGLATLATATSAQKDFFSTHARGVKIIPLSTTTEQLTLALKWFINHPVELMEMRKYQDELAKTTYNWEQEQLKFISIVNQCLQKKSLS